MKGLMLRHRITLLIVLAVGLILPIAADRTDTPVYTPDQKEFYLDSNALAFTQPGLKVDIQSAQIAGSTATVTFRIADDKGAALDKDGVATPGVVALNFVLARIAQGDRQYTAYTTRLQPNATTGKLFLQANRDLNGAYTSADNGVYTYTFGTKMPPDLDPTVTHTVGIYATRDLQSFGLALYVGNAVFDWVPAGGPVTVVRDIVRTENCNACHDPLAHHGSNARREVRLCVLCHTPQSTDAVTGGPIDFKVMIHKIHRGADLPSVQAGGTYKVSTEDFSTVEFPRDIRLCDTCHKNGTQSENYLTQPGQAACGACHDDVNFATGQGHGLGGVQTSDANCTLCHAPDTGRVFDISIKGAHVIPERITTLGGVNLSILSVDGTSPGSNPTVSFQVTDNKGSVIDLAKLDSVQLTLGGPTSDFKFSAREDARLASASPTAYVYKFKAAIPPDAKGTFIVAGDGYRDVKLTKVDNSSVTARDAAANTAFYFAVTDKSPVKRRTVVSITKCNGCHEQLTAHDGTRSNLEYCPACHRPNATDAAARPKDQLPAESLDFKNMIHKIHTGTQLANDYTFYDAETGEPGSFNGIRFPGDRRNCAKCHEGTSYQLPLPQGLLATTTDRGFFSPTPPTATACLACHDNISAAAHAFVNIAPFGEACATCHAEDAQFAVTKVHAR